MKLCVIPARGGSKRIPRKNVKQFCGKPMISFSIATAIESGYFDRVIVSTDDAEIADVAKDCGAEVPFFRPHNLSDDHTGTIPVMHHAIEWMNKNGENVALACCLYATAPFVLGKDLGTGLNLIEGSELDYVFSASSYSYPIQRAFEIDNAGRINMFQAKHFFTRSQDLVEAWHDAGQFYWGTAEAWCEERVVFTQQSSVVKLPRFRVQDIDTIEDWERAEWLFKAMRAEGVV
ncbi:pseudaminic acid cytidylyltransferase [Vibrio sp. S4M6]|uniref:pseudaminic acid cytidylyltransferase n=1 Tax=Vibrio sinus TaxID=2946865 RepID=UPI00202A942E|nr:pseudaminic acid cytidylyltransferase [Vibrio sinus]MCL9781548.1 pseudaminic acid cytidylyltransferase [Vibrio sinus]